MPVDSQSIVNKFMIETRVLSLASIFGKHLYLAMIHYLVGGWATPFFPLLVLCQFSSRSGMLSIQSPLTYTVPP